MKIINTDISGIIVIKPNFIKDKRGHFVETYNKSKFKSCIGKIDFVQDNESKSSKGVLRGLHFQKPPLSQSKLVRCTEGKVLDVALDIRKGSPTYGTYHSIILSEENKKQLFIPTGFAHGFIVLSDIAVLSYKVDNFYSPDHDAGIRWNDKELNIKWGLKDTNILVSEKDSKLPFFSEFNSPFSY